MIEVTFEPDNRLARHIDHGHSGLTPREETG
jgi:hypothetical protein